MRYLVWAVVALLSYSAVGPLVSLATRTIPVNLVTLVANAILVLVALGLVLFGPDPILPYLSGDGALPMYAAGVLVAVAVFAYYRALALGPVSVVVPVFGLFIVGSAVVGVVLLDEALTARKVAGIGFAVVAIYLTAA